MKLNDLFARLSYGAFSNLSIGNSGEGTILESAHAKLVLYTNEALLRIHSRFVLKEKALVLETLEAQTNYPLRKEFAEFSGSNALYKYIRDSKLNPFEGDVIKILEVFNSDNESLVLNDKDNPRSLFTPQPDVLQVPDPILYQGLGVLYQARHSLLTAEGDSYLDQEIVLPFFLEEALQAFIAHKNFIHMNGQDNTLLGQRYMSDFEGMCQDIEARDLVNNTTSTSHSKLERRGFP